MHIDYLPLSSQLTMRHPDNPKHHNLELLAESFDRFGYTMPVALDENKGVVFAGHGRLEQLHAMQQQQQRPPNNIRVQNDEWMVPTITGVSFATDDELYAYLIADNQTTITGGWLDEMLQKGLVRIKENTRSLAGTGFSDEDLESLLDELKPDEPQTPIALEINEKWQVKPGQLWLIKGEAADHFIYCGSCLDETALERMTVPEKIDFVFADPPYGIDIVRSDGKIGSGSTFLPIDGDDTTDIAIASHTFYRNLCPKATHIWWGANHYNELPGSPCWIVWDKENDFSSFADCELAWTNQTGAVRIFRHMWNGAVTASESGDKRLHPTQKPIALVEWCYEQYGVPGMIVLDPFLGSGPSLIAAENYGAHVRGFELEPAYVAVCLERMIARGLEVERVS